MATIVFLQDVDEFAGSRKGLTFDKSQAGPYVKKRPSPINNQTNPRMLLRRSLKAANAFFWALTAGQKNAWAILAAASGITGPFGMTGHQAGCAMFFALQINSNAAGDGFYANHPPHNPIIPPTNQTLTQIDQTTIRTTFTPAPQWPSIRIYLRQALPGPGVRRWSPVDGYIAEYSELSPASPHDFTPHFSHRSGWHGRYWLGTQRTCGCRSAETLFDL